MLALVEHQQDLIAAYEKQVEQTILQSVQVILPEFVASIEDIDVRCEAAVSNLIMETTRHNTSKETKWGQHIKEKEIKKQEEAPSRGGQ